MNTKEVKITDTENTKQAATLILEDFNKVCRLCISKENNIPILGTQIDEIDATYLIKTYINIEVSINDPYPLNICENCLLELYNINQYRKQCEDIQSIFKQLLGHNKPPFECDLCRNGYKTSEELFAHTETVHTQSHKEAPNIDLKNNLALQLASLFQYQCYECGKQYKTLEEILYHKRDVHLIIACDICALKIPSTQRDAHMKNHPAKETNAPFKCNQCSLGYQTDGELFRHKEANHKYYDCQLCQRTVRMQARLAHLKTHESLKTDQSLPFTCFQCPNEYHTKDELLAHRNTHKPHPQQKDGEKHASNILKKISCKHCGNKYQNFKELLRHESAAHKGAEEGPLTAPLEPNCAENIDCVNETKEDLRRLLHAPHARASLKTPPKLFNCHQCKAEYGTLDELLRHRETLHKRFDFKVCSEKVPFEDQSSHMETHKNAPETVELPFRCSDCSSLFRVHEELIFHRRDAHWIIECILCKERISGTQKDAHTRMHQSQEKYFNAPNNILNIKCNQCNREFGTDEELFGHKLTMHKYYDCHHCKQTVLMKDRLAHLKTHKEQEVEQVAKLAEDCPFKCYQCPSEYTTRTDLLSHRKLIHKFFTCDVCHVQLANFMRDEHMKTHSSRTETIVIGAPVRRIGGRVPAAPCDVCGRKFRTAGALERHKRDHLPFLCEVCGVECRDKCRLWRHRKYAHAVEKSFICEICGFIAKRRENLNMHRRIHREKRFLCTFCGGRYRKLGELEAHQRVHTGEKPYVCKVCSKRFARSLYRNHMRVHTGLKPYGCKVCPMRFGWRNHLKRHMFKHSGVKPHVCRFCGKAWSCKYNLKVHERIHTGERPYTCEKCDAKFASSAYLRQHSRRCKV